MYLCCLLTSDSIVKDELTRLFRHHGALDIPRPVIFPITAENDSFEIARVLGPDGTMLVFEHAARVNHAANVYAVYNCAMT